MVNTRRLAQSPRDGDDVSTPGSPMSAKQLRQIRKLTIDGESALGGAGTLKRRRPAGRSSLNPDTLSPAPVHGSSQTEVSKTQPTLQSESHQAHPTPKQHLSHSPAQRRSNKTSTAIDPTKSETRMTTSPPRQLPPRPREEHWFLPSDVSRESSPKVVDEKSPSTVPPPPETAKARRAPISQPTSSHTPSAPSNTLKKESMLAEQTEPIELEPNGVEKTVVSNSETKGPTARRKSQLTKAQRELKRLGFESGQKVGGDSKADLSSSTDGLPVAPTQQLETKDTTQGPGDTSVVPSLPLNQENPAVIRALKKLEIAANSSLSGVEREKQRHTGDRRSSRMLRGNGPSNLRKQRPAPRAQASQPRVEKRIERFPNVPPKGLADHLLSLLATAAQEQHIVRLLAGDARNAIMRDIRNEGFHSQQQRLQREIAAMQAWEMASESEVARLEAMFEANKENRDSGDTSVMTNGELLCSFASSVPDDLASTSILNHPRCPTGGDLADGSRRTSGSSQQGYFTASDAGSPQPDRSSTSSNDVLGSKKRPAETPISEAVTPVDHGEALSPIRTETPELLHNSKRPKLSHESTNTTSTANATEKSRMSSDGDAASDHDTPQDEQPPSFPAKLATTRILTPDDGGTIPLDGWKGKHKAHTGSNIDEAGLTDR